MYGGDGGLQDRVAGETGRLAEQRGAGWLGGRWHRSRTGGMVGRGIERGGDRVAGGDGGLQDRVAGETERLAEQRGAGWLGGRWHRSRTGGMGGRGIVGGGEQGGWRGGGELAQGREAGAGPGGNGNRATGREGIEGAGMGPDGTGGVLGGGGGAGMGLGRVLAGQECRQKTGGRC